MASDFVNRFHRHYNAPVGCKFCLAVAEEEKIRGVAICDRPVSRRLDNGFTCEILRVCTDGTYNACSMLYGACCRIAKKIWAIPTSSHILLFQKTGQA
ncbi:XF1762 family protein [Ruminococcus sp. 25CYCFAH16]